jgi:hypothetical protein
MTGSAYPEMLVSIMRKFQAGDVEEAEDLFAAYLPILRHEPRIADAFGVREDTVAVAQCHPPHDNPKDRHDGGTRARGSHRR